MSRSFAISRPPRSPRRRSVDSRCTGRCCRRAARGSARAPRLRRRASRPRSTTYDAHTAMPGVQMPHCAPPQRTSSRCTACNTSPCASPSTVVTLRPSHCPAATRHELTTSPSSITVHAPHSPSPQPSLVPVRRRSSRKRSSRRFHGEASTTRSVAVDLDRDLHDRLHASRTGFGRERQRIERAAERVLDGIRDRRGRTIHRNLADALRAARSERIRTLDDHGLELGRIGERRHDAVRHVRVDDLAVLVQRRSRASPSRAPAACRLRSGPARSPG